MLKDESKERTYQEANVKFDQTECVICLYEYLPESKVKIMNACGHVFHTPCINAWLDQWAESERERFLI